MKCRVQCTPNKIIRYMLNAPLKFHVDVNEFKYVGLLPVEYRVQKLKFGHMYNIINGNAPDYLRTNIDMVRNQHLYSTRARDLDEVCFYIDICQWNNLPLATKQCHSKKNLKMKPSPFYLAIWFLRIKISMLRHNIMKLNLLIILILSMCMIITLSK